MTPSRTQVIEAMRPAMQEARRCSEHRAIVSVSFAFTSDGCIEHHSTVTPDEGQTTTDDIDAWCCVVAATTIVRFEPFSQERFKVKFPFRVGPQ